MPRQPFNPRVVPGPYIYEWRGAAYPGVRAPTNSNLGDWPPVIDSGPERYSQASIQPYVTFKSGEPPAKPVTLGDLPLLNEIPGWMIMLGIGAGVWWYMNKSKPARSGGNGHALSGMGTSGSWPAASPAKKRKVKGKRKMVAAPTSSVAGALGG